MKKYIEELCKQAIEDNPDCKDINFLTGSCVRIQRDIKIKDFEESLKELLK